MIYSSAEELRAGLTRYHGAYSGVVVDREDPEGLHRVRVEVPGLIDKSAWAWPVTGGGGSKQRGAHIVPALGADVIVWFIGGDVERPIYAGAWWGVAESPTEALAAADESHDVQSLELKDILITVDERDGRRAVELRNKVTGDFIVIDIASGVMKVRMTAAILLEAIGQIDLKAAAITLNERVVLPDSKPIS